MSLEDIKSKIVAKAEEKARDILQKGGEEADYILQQGSKEAGGLKKETVSKAQAEALIKKKRIIGTASLQIRNDILQERQEALKEAFRLASKKVADLPKKEYQSFIANIILNAPIENANEVKISCNTRDKDRITEELLKKIGSKLVAMNRKIRLTLSAETRNIQGGIIISTGGMEINHSLDIVLRFLRDGMEIEVYKSLFGDLG